jgi:hypothetical protein
MKKGGRISLEKISRDILRDHLNVGRGKPVSYLPINTVEKIIGISIQAYTAEIGKSGNKFAIFSEKECCIKSGAVYSYNNDELNNILNKHKDVLHKNKWPATPDGFIKRIASEWLDEQHPMMPIIKEAFGDE